jgi:HAD superfamily hydrolase (TIGR01484 family)
VQDLANHWVIAAFCRLTMLPPAVRPFAQMPHPVLARVRGVMTDIDDTLTAEGAITPAALQALHALHDAGVPVVAITGRPLGWSRPFAQAWPVRAIVAENGAVALLPNFQAKDQTVLTEYAQDEPLRQRNAKRLAAVAQQVLQQVPGALLAQDSAGRETDIAVDHSEFTQLPQRGIDQVVALMRAAGMHATVSSIHINGWFGEHNKWTAAQWMVKRLFLSDLTQELDQWLYVGDSTNDQLMFEHFPLAVGVANLMRFAADLRVWPAYITQAERGDGFAEVAAALLSARVGTAKA